MLANFTLAKTNVKTFKRKMNDKTPTALCFELRMLSQT